MPEEPDTSAGLRVDKLRRRWEGEKARGGHAFGTARGLDNGRLTEHSVSLHSSALALPEQLPGTSHTSMTLYTLVPLPLIPFAPHFPSVILEGPG